mgnify:CR=1 FL=1
MQINDNFHSYNILHLNIIYMQVLNNFICFGHIEISNFYMTEELNYI